MRDQSSSEKLPDRRWEAFTRPSEEIMRSVTCSADISIVKIPAATPFAIAALSAMFTASVDLPTDGRPAITTRRPGSSPALAAPAKPDPAPPRPVAKCTRRPPLAFGGGGSDLATGRHELAQDRP